MGSTTLWDEVEADRAAGRNTAEADVCPICHGFGDTEDTGVDCIHCNGTGDRKVYDGKAGHHAVA